MAIALAAALLASGAAPASAATSRWVSAGPWVTSTPLPGPGRDEPQPEWLNQAIVSPGEAGVLYLGVADRETAAGRGTA